MWLRELISEVIYTGEDLYINFALRTLLIKLFLHVRRIFTTSGNFVIDVFPLSLSYIFWYVSYQISPQGALPLFLA